MQGNPPFVTIEIVMFFALGFFIAMLMMLAFMPAVHERAVRLTRRKLERTPLSEKEMQTEKDRLRADFAMSTRKLEHDIDRMQHKATEHFTEIARKGETIAQLKQTLDERDTLIAQLQEQTAHGSAAGQRTDSELQALRIETTAKTMALDEANKRIAALMAEIGTLTAALDRRIRVYDTQQHEIMALTNQSNLLQMQLTALAQPMQRPSPAPAPAARYMQVDDTETHGESDVIRRALEAIEANGNGHALPQGWISPPSNGAVPFGH